MLFNHKVDYFAMLLSVGIHSALQAERVVKLFSTRLMPYSLEARGKRV